MMLNLRKRANAFLGMLFILCTQCVAAAETQMTAWQSMSQRLAGVKQSFCALPEKVQYTAYVTGAATAAALAVYGGDYYRDSRDWNATLNDALVSDSWLANWRAKRALRVLQRAGGLTDGQIVQRVRNNINVQPLIVERWRELRPDLVRVAFARNRDRDESQLLREFSELITGYTDRLDVRQEMRNFRVRYQNFESNPGRRNERMFELLNANPELLHQYVEQAHRDLSPEDFEDELQRAPEFVVKGIVKHFAGRNRNILQALRAAHPTLFTEEYVRWLGYRAMKNLAPDLHDCDGYEQQADVLEVFIRSLQPFAENLEAIYRMLLGPITDQILWKTYIDHKIGSVDLDHFSAFIQEGHKGIACQAVKSAIEREHIGQVMKCLLHQKVDPFEEIDGITVSSMFTAAASSSSSSSASSSSASPVIVDAKGKGKKRKKSLTCTIFEWYLCREGNLENLAAVCETIEIDQMKQFCARLFEQQRFDLLRKLQAIGISGDIDFEAFGILPLESVEAYVELCINEAGVNDEIRQAIRHDVLKRIRTDRSHVAKRYVDFIIMAVIQESAFQQRVQEVYNNHVVILTDLIQKQHGDQCGYYAAFYASELVKYLRESMQAIISEKSYPDVFKVRPDIHDLKAFAAEHFADHCNASLENMDGDAVHMLLEKKFGMDPSHFTVIESVEHFLPEAPIAGGKSASDAISSFLAQDEGVHTFIICDHQHWTFMVAHKRNATEPLCLYVADSKNYLTGDAEADLEILRAALGDEAESFDLSGASSSSASSSSSTAIVEPAKEATREKAHSDFPSVMRIAYFLQQSQEERDLAQAIYDDFNQAGVLFDAGDLFRAADFIYKIVDYVEAHDALDSEHFRLEYVNDSLHGRTGLASMLSTINEFIGDPKAREYLSKITIGLVAVVSPSSFSFGSFHSELVEGSSAASSSSSSARVDEASLEEDDDSDDSDDD